MRSIRPSFVVAPPSGRRIRTSIRTSDRDAAVLWEVGRHLGRLAGQDLAVRVVIGRHPDGKHAGRADRKKALTTESNSRWAGSITGRTADQYERGIKPC